MNNKTLVLFVFHQLNDRVENFFNKSIFKDDNIDFIVIYNNKNIKININLPTYVKYLERDNIGYDFGGWSDGLLTNDLYQNYHQFIFVNSSVIGPFIPAYCSLKWTDIYLNGLKDNIKLFGSTINTIENPMFLSHIQSYIFSMNRETLDYLIEKQIFSVEHYVKTFDEAVWLKEVGMSREIINKGWNIGSLMTIYDGVDFTFKTKKYTDYNIKFLGDVMYPQFNGSVWNKYELVFIKGNRGVMH